MAETPEQRSRTMRAVKSRDSQLELSVRRLIHSMGYRYRLHRRDLPGKPDLVFPARRKVIFLHGCFWHGHTCRRGRRQPKTNVEYWTAKIAGNRRRDKKVQAELAAQGWQILVIWECQIRDESGLRQRIVDFLKPSNQ